MHDLYMGFDTKVYQEFYQVRGSLHHEIIENKKYSTEKRYLQAIEVYSEEYNLIGKIDIYDSLEKMLIERKTKIKKIYDGYWYQLYGQYLSLIEQGFEVKKLCLHSLLDNKRYYRSVDDEKLKDNFEDLMKKINSLTTNELKTQINTKKCHNCIYNYLCRRL